MSGRVTRAERVSFATATATRIPLPVQGRKRADVIGLRPMQSAPAPPGRPVPGPVQEHWSATFVDAVTSHVWRREALDAFESHAFTGAPGTERWCTRCTYMLPTDWKDPKKPVPLPCGDARIAPRPAMYEYVDGNPVNGIQLADPDYAGAKVKEG